MPDYPDQARLRAAEEQITEMPPLVFAGEAAALRKALASVVHGEAFLLQGGNCAESFSQFSANRIRDDFKVMLQMAIALTFGGGLPVVKIGRIAGQFAKPRSGSMETVGDISLPSYRGDIINDIAFDPKARIPDPQRMLAAYHQSSATLNLLRAFAHGGYASLQEIHRWNLDFVARTRQGKRYEQMALSIDEAMRFMAACGITSSRVPELRMVDFYISHEALLLGYEQALTRIDSRTGNAYGCSGHFLWIGERTRQLDHAHVEYMRGIHNPIGMKCGPTMTADELLRLCDKLDPRNDPGRLTLITRFGADQIEQALPKLIRAVKREGRNIVWSCDPMHGNTVKSKSGFKTRAVSQIISEIRQFFAIHHSESTYPGGVHLEMTSENVTECLGGAQEITDTQLSDRYHSYCDPRLNGSQSLEIAFELSELLREHRHSISNQFAA